MKKILLSIILISSFLHANKKKENPILNKINDLQKKELKSKNYENFNMETIKFYSKVDESNLYLKLLINKLNQK